jgi:hypothetical protein
MNATASAGEPTRKKAAIYARFQNERSIEDQVAPCPSYAVR